MKSDLDCLCCVVFRETSLRSKSEWVAGKSDYVSQSGQNLAKMVPEVSY